ncbi:MAG: sensor histidine kinase [Chloroflexota bacterium]
MTDPDTSRLLTNTRNPHPYFLWLMWIVWLSFLIPPVSTLIRLDTVPLHLVVTLGLLAVFVGIYMSATWRNAQSLNALVPLKSEPIPKTKWLTIAACIVLSVVIATLGRGYGFFGTFIFTSAFVSGSLPARRAIPTIGVILIVIFMLGWLGNFDVTDSGNTIIVASVVSITTLTMSRSIVAGQELRAAREEITHLAVMNERLRIARDLHDLLGHSLSLITLKSELAGRLMAVAPDRAAIEIHDIETVARTTLQEVREAVALYRQPRLSSELHGTREILAAAGIGYQFEGDEHQIDTLPQTSEAVFAWAVREGVTNVIRHSRAHQCTIRLTHTIQTASIEIIDDGIGNSIAAAVSQGEPKNTSSGGNGLYGLRERVALLNGQCESGPCPNGGFRLAVTMPLIQQIQQNNEVVAMPTALLKRPAELEEKS